MNPDDIMNPDNNNLQSVEAVLARPQNQSVPSVTAPSRTATTPATSVLDELAPTQTATGLDSVRMATATAQGGADLDNLAPEGVRLASDEAAGASRRDGLRSVVDAARKGAQASRTTVDTMPNAGDNALTRLAKSLRGEQGFSGAEPVVAAPRVEPVAPAAKTFLAPITLARSAFGRGDVQGYDYGGMRFELPQSVNVRDVNAVNKYMETTNGFIDWMNEEED